MNEFKEKIVLDMVKKAQFNHITGNKKMVIIILEELRIMLEDNNK